MYCERKDRARSTYGLPPSGLPPVYGSARREMFFLLSGASSHDTCPIRAAAAQKSELVRFAIGSNCA